MQKQEHSAAGLIAYSGRLRVTDRFGQQQGTSR